MGSAEVGGKIFLTTNVLLKYEKVRISVKKDNNELMEHFFKLHSKWSQNAITVREELAMQYRSLEKAMKMDSTALMEHFLSLLIGESSTVKEEHPDESLDSLTSQPTQSASIGEASTPPVMEYHNTSLSQDGSTSASPRNLVQIRDTALCSTSSNAAIKNPGALYIDNQSSCVPTVHIPLDSGVLMPQLSGTSSFSHTFGQKRKLSSSSDGDVPASKIPGIQHQIHHLHPPQSLGEPLQQESIPDRRSLIDGTTGQHLFGYQTGSTRNDYGRPSATFSLQDIEQQQNHGLRTSALPSDLSKDSRRDISKTALDFIEGVSQVTSVDNVHSLRLSVDRVNMGSIVGSEPLERQNVLGMNMSQQSAKGLRQNRVSMDNSVNIHPQPGSSGVNQNISGSMTEFDLSAVKIEVNSDEDLEDVSHESGDQEALAAMVTDAGYSNSLEKQYSIPKAGIYKAEIASMNGMVELVKGTNVYVHHDEYRTAINKSIPKLYKLRDTSQEILKDGKRIARYLMSIFFEKKELQERSLTNSELSRYPPLNQKIVSTILEGKANKDDLKSISRSKRRQFSSHDPLDAAQTEEHNKESPSSGHARPLQLEMIELIPGTGVYLYSYNLAIASKCKPEERGTKKHACHMAKKLMGVFFDTKEFIGASLSAGSKEKKILDQRIVEAIIKGKIWRKAPGDTLASESRFHQFYMGNKEPSRNRGLLFRLPPPKKNKSSRSHPDFLSFEQIKNSLNFSQVDWSYFYSAQKSWSIKEKFEYLYSIIDRKFEKPLIRIQASFHLGYYVCRYEELDRVECFSVIRKHMSLRHARNYRLLYRELGYYRTLAHCTVPTRHIIMRVKYVRDLIKSQSQEEIQFLMFPPNRDPYQFLKAYEEWYSLNESAVYQLGLPDNHCGSSVIEQNTQKILMDITKEGMWKIENFLNNSAEEDKYLLMYNKGSSGNCIVLHRNKSGKFSLEDDRLQCLKNMEPEDKVHLLAIK